MVEVTIKSDFGENRAARRTEHRAIPCDLAFVVCISPMNNGRNYHNDTCIVGEEGMDTRDVPGTLAETTVKTLLTLAGDSKERRARVLAAYMEGFTSMALNMAETAVMDKTAKLLMEEE